MSRDLSAGVAAQLNAALLRPVLFFEAEFVDGFLRFWSGMGNMSWNGYTWLGFGNLISVSEIVETAKVTAQGMSVSLAAPSSIIAEAQAQAQHGRTGKVWLGVLDSSGVVIADPYLAFSGWLDVPSIEDSGDTCTVTISYESRLIALQTPKVRRWDEHDSKIDWAGERGFEYVSALPLQVLEW